MERIVDSLPENEEDEETKSTASSKRIHLSFLNEIKTKLRQRFSEEQASINPKTIRGEEKYLSFTFEGPNPTPILEFKLEQGDALVYSCTDPETLVLPKRIFIIVCLDKDELQHSLRTLKKFLSQSILVYMNGSEWTEIRNYVTSAGVNCLLGVYRVNSNMWPSVENYYLRKKLKTLTEEKNRVTDEKIRITEEKNRVTEEKNRAIEERDFYMEYYHKSQGELTGKFNLQEGDRDPDYTFGNK